MGESGYSLFNLYLLFVYSKVPQDPMVAAARNKLEYLMPNKEIPMMKFNDFDCFLRPMTFFLDTLQFAFYLLRKLHTNQWL